MSPQKEVFKNPVVRIPIDKIGFPRICPICGKEANKPARVTARPGIYRYLRPSWDPAFWPRVRRSAGINPPESKSLILYVCEDHYRSDEGDSNYKTLCIVCDGLIAMALLFALFEIGGTFWLGRMPTILSITMVPVFFIALVITIVAFRAGPLRNAIRIVGFDAGIQNVWLAFKRSDYREAFIEANPIYAEEVRWIRRA